MLEAEEGMRGSDLKIIKVIGGREGLNLAELMRASGLGWSAVYSSIERLVQEGFVERRLSAFPKFPKTCRLYLTERGRRVYECLKGGGVDLDVKLSEVDRKMILSIGEGEVKVSDIRMRTGLSWSSILKHLDVLKNMGLISECMLTGFPRKRLVKLTDEGVKVLHVLRMEEDIVARFAEGGVQGEICGELTAAAIYTSKNLSAQNLAGLLKGYCERPQIGFEELREMAEEISRGIKAIVHPPPPPEAHGAVAKAVLAALKHILSDMEIRSKIAEARNFTLHLTLNLSHINKPPEELNEILLWLLTLPQT